MINETDVANEQINHMRFIISACRCLDSCAQRMSISIHLTAFAMKTEIQKPVDRQPS